MSTLSSPPIFPPSSVSCNGLQINCAYSDGSIQADPDIAGIGVLVSFILGSMFTFAAVIVGYFTFSLNGNTTNEVDDLVITRIRRLLRLGDRKHINTDTKRTRADALTRFVLALSDQQLVTGLAVLITGYYKRCTISGYHFNLVANLAWFSSTCHLSTLAVLHDYLIHHRVLRTCRVIGMISVMGLLFHAQLYIQWYPIPSLPIQCTFVNGFPVLNPDEYYGLGAFNERIQWLAIVIFLFFAYGNNLIRLYAAPATGILSWFELSLRRQLGPLPQLSTIEKYQTRRGSLQSRSGKLTVLQALSKWVKILWLDIEVHVTIFMESFLWEIVWMMFGNAFGIMQIYSTRWDTYAAPFIEYANYKVNGSESAMSFGQMVALLLVMLPVLAAGEAYYDIQPWNQDSPAAAPTYGLPSPSLELSDDPLARSDQTNHHYHNNKSTISELKVFVVATCFFLGLGFFAAEAGLFWGSSKDSMIAVEAMILLVASGIFVKIVAMFYGVCNEAQKEAKETRGERAVRQREQEVIAREGDRSGLNLRDS